MNKYFAFLVLMLLTFSTCGQVSFTFKDALLKASTNNPELKIEAIRIGYADAELVTAKLRPNLMFNNQFLELMENVSNPKQPFVYANRQVWYQLTKPMMLGNQRQKRIGMALQTRKISLLELEEKRRIIYNEVGTKWLNLWFHKVELHTILEAKANIDSLLEMNVDRLKSGEIPTIEALRTQLLSEQYELQLMNIRQYYSEDVNDLKTYLNHSDSIDVDVRMTMQVMDVADSEDSLIGYALANRPDLLLIKEQLGWSNKNLEYQRSLRLPFMELGAIYNPQNGIVYAGTFATISVPLFNRNQGHIKSAMVEVQENNAQIYSHEARIKNEVKKAYQTYQSNRKIMERFQSILMDSRMLLNTITTSYLSRKTSVYDYLEAQRSFLSTQELYYEAMFNYRKSYLELIFATGLINKVI